MGHRFWRHRAEPLLQERMWGCDLPLPDALRERQEWSEEAGYDAAGRCVAWRQVPDGATETVRREDGVVVATLDGGEARTSHERTEYADGSVETYEYDAAGRLVAIVEPENLWHSCNGTERIDTGGRLEVAYEGDDPVAIHGPYGEVWARPTVAWEVRLAEAAERIADLVIAEVQAGVDERLFALNLVYVDQGSLHLVLMVGGSDDSMECDLPDDLDDALLRDACIGQPGDPYRVVLGAVARVIARRELPVPVTDDFVVYMSEHDEGTEAKVEAIRACNPPERVARWAAAWQGSSPPL